MSRCLYNSSFEKFINADNNSIFGALCDNYHGDALTTTREAWKPEISIIKGVLSNYEDKNGQVYKLQSNMQMKNFLEYHNDVVFIK